MYPYIEIFDRSISTYGLVAIFSSILCGLLFIISLRKTGSMIEDGIFFLMFVLLGSVIGSHLLYAITQYRFIPYLFERCEFSIWLNRVQYIFGGSVFYGGLLGGMLSGYVGLKILKQNIGTYSDLMAPILPLFHGIARIGCFFAGCCYGIPCEWGFVAGDNPIVPEVCGVARFPVQLLECACNIILSAVLWSLLRRSHHSTILSGNLFKIYLIAYGIVRFADEFLRGDINRGFWGIFSTSQWISIATVSISTIVLVRSIIYDKNKENG